MVKECCLVESLIEEFFVEGLNVNKMEKVEVLFFNELV